MAKLYTVIVFVTLIWLTGMHLLETLSFDAFAISLMIFVSTMLLAKKLDELCSAIKETKKD